ncbi:hypothetical protein EVAR_63126_1 [Eumeta japonica]|uniref:Uncharacterized protein n=1 Tax=Eumeta variegata TaxID=151549 RepID=A0A4C1S9P8_EUMVA|nr:hypothetical protein EVAR_63126_1 [Eumeta japonica]
MINNSETKPTRSLRSLLAGAAGEAVLAGKRGGAALRDTMPRGSLARLLPQSGCEFCAAMKLRMKICTGWLTNEQLLNKTVQESSVERSQRLASQNFELWRTGNGNRVLIVLNVWPHRMPELWLTAINPVLNVLNVWPHKFPNFG